MPTKQRGICWPHVATVGQLTVTDPFIIGDFPASAGNDAQVACNLLDAGKFRNGAPRRWCRTHQTYWGVLADLPHPLHCKNHALGMGYALDPLVLDLSAHTRVALSLARDGAITVSAGALSGDYPAVAIAAPAGLFGDPAIVQVNITPPALHAWCAMPGQTCHACPCCAHPHLDLGDFALRAHRRHYCGNCGSDSNTTKYALISSPLASLASWRGHSNVRTILVI